MARTLFLLAVAFAAGICVGRATDTSPSLAGVYAAVSGPGGQAADLAAIEALHKKDVAATLSGDPNALVQLWTDDAVRLEPGSAPEVGRETIHRNDVTQKTENPDSRILTYVPHIVDVQLINDWAVEWGTFEASFQPSAAEKSQSIHAKALRVMRRQSDGSWKFARVMWNQIGEN